MTDLFVDTSGWAELFRPAITGDICRTIYAARISQKKKVLTTNYVITEVVALLENRFRCPRRELIELIDELNVSRNVHVIHIDIDTHRNAWSLLSSRLDKAWSLVDCSSFVVMKERGITDALTTDHHFEQAGFTVLLK